MWEDPGERYMTSSSFSPSWEKRWKNSIERRKRIKRVCFGQFLSRRGLQIPMKFAEWNRLSWTVSFRCQTCKTLSLSCYLSLASSLFLHLIVRVCMIGDGIFWTGSLTIHKVCSSSCWKEVQWKSPSLPFHDTSWWSNQNPQDESPKASCFQLFSSVKIFFFFPLPKMMLPFKGFLICKLFPQFISLQ